MCACVCVCVRLRGLPLCQNSSVTPCNDQRPLRDPLPHSLTADQPTEQELLSHAAHTPLTHANTHLCLHTYVHTPLLYRVFRLCILFSPSLVLRCATVLYFSTSGFQLTVLGCIWDHLQSVSLLPAQLTATRFILPLLLF